MPEYSDIAGAVGFNEGMTMMKRAGGWALVACLAAVIGMSAWTQDARSGQQPGRVRPADAEQLFALANLARMHAGAGQLRWDPALAEAARLHCLRMAQEGPIEHRYGGEPSLTERAATAGARFSRIEENVAVGPSANAIHEEWMNSPPHRANLLSPKVDRIGTAIVAARGTLYAVADFSAAVQQLSRAQVEAKVADLIRVSGVAILPDAGQARAACATDQGMPPAKPGMQPLFLMRWQSSSLDVLPKGLTEKLASGRYRRASVGSCKAEGAQDSFSAYRVAVLLY